MDKVFEAELIHPPEERNDACATIALPAMPYELRDALDKVRIPDGGNMTVEITRFAPEMEFLADYMETGACKVPALFALNALAEKIARMNPTERAAFEGLVRMELRETGVIPAARLYGLAANTDRCHVIEAGNDRELGRFYVDNGFLPEYENVPEMVVEHLDYAKIGGELREKEKGVFLSGGGYVVRHEELAETAEDFTPREPGYTVLLKVSRRERAALLKLPASPGEMDAALDAVEAADWPDVSIRCVDCKAPALMDAITATENAAHANRAARILESLPDRQLSMYKALLEAAGVRNLASALEMTGWLDQYVFTPAYASPADVALSELRFMLEDEAADMLIPYVNLHNYGLRVIEYDHLSMTPYGAIERRDGKPIREISDRQAERPDGEPDAGTKQEKPCRKNREASR